MPTVILFIAVIGGIMISMNAVFKTGLAEAWEAMRNMVILMIIFIACAFYIYLTRTNTILVINF